MKKQLLLCAVSSVFLIIIAGTAWATDYSSYATGVWREQEEISPGNFWMKVWHTAVGSYPGSSDSATINSGHTVSITNDETVANLNFSGVLDLQSSHIFTVLTTGLVYGVGATNQNGTTTGHFENYGTMSADGNLHMGDTPFWNQVGAVYNIRNDSSITAYGGGVGHGAFINYGTLRKSGGTGVSFLCEGNNVGFQNLGGTIEVLSGTLVIGGGRTSTSGTFKVSSGAVLSLLGYDNHRYDGIYTGEGNGTVALTGGTMTVSATVFNFTNDMFRLQGGTVAGSFSNLGRICSEGTSLKTLDGGNVDNYGTWNHRGSGSLKLNEEVFSNKLGAVFDIQEDGQMTYYAGGVGRAAFRNYGTIRKSGGTGTFTIPRLENLGGTIEVQSGRLALREPTDAGSTSGLFDVHTNAVLDLTDGNVGRYYGTWSGTGDGTVVLTGGTVTVSATVLNFTNDMFRWQGGTINGAYQSVSNIGRVWTEGTDTKIMDGINIQNYGTWNHRGTGHFKLNEAIFSNHVGAVFDIQEDGEMEDYSGAVGRSAFRNYGTMHKSGGAGTFTVKRFHNDGGTFESQSGTLYVEGGYDQSDGITRLAGGNISANSTIAINGGTLTGTGTVSATVSSSGTVSPGLSAGILNIAGNYSQGGSGTLAIEIGGRMAGTEYDRLAISGSATLSGTLNVVLTNGFSPALTDSFMIVTCASQSGTFTSTNAAALGADRRWRVGYSNTAVYLQMQSITVSLTSPTNGTVLTAPGSVTLSATITDTAGTVTQVSFYVDGSLAGTSSSSGNPYTWNWSAPAGSHTVVSYAWDNVGLMATSESVSVTVAPDAPTSVAASKGTYTDKVSVSWASVSGAAGYQVWRNTANSSAAATLSGATTGTSYDDTGSTPGTLYYYWVKATNAVATSLFSSSDSGYRALPAPTGVQASDSAYTDKVLVQWTAVSAAAGYQVWRNTSGSSDSATLLGITTATLYSDTTAAAGTPYYFWVKATNATGVSAFSSPDAGTRRAADPTPAPIADIGVWIAAYNQTDGGIWKIWLSDGNIATISTFGATNWVPVLGDFDGDGRGDLAVYKESLAEWALLLSGLEYSVAVVWAGVGGPGYVPAIGDYDGDGADEVGTYKAATGTWMILLTGGGMDIVTSSDGFLGDAASVAIPADFDGDGKADMAVYAAATGTWQVRLSLSGYALGIVSGFGSAGSTAKPKDYDGDGKADLGYYEPSTGNWVLKLSRLDYVTVSTPFGGPMFEAIPGDYDRDGLADLAIYDESTGEWLIRLTSKDYGQASVTLGGANYTPLGAMVP